MSDPGAALWPPLYAQSSRPWFPLSYRLLAPNGVPGVPPSLHLLGPDLERWALCDLGQENCSHQQACHQGGAAASQGGRPCGESEGPVGEGRGSMSPPQLLPEPPHEPPEVTSAPLLFPSPVHPPAPWSSSQVTFATETGQGVGVGSWQRVTPGRNASVEPGPPGTRSLEGLHPKACPGPTPLALSLAP